MFLTLLALCRHTYPTLALLLTFSFPSLSCSPLALSSSISYHPLPSLPLFPPLLSPPIPSYVPGAGLSPRRVEAEVREVDTPSPLAPRPFSSSPPGRPLTSPLKSSLFTPDAPPPTCPIHKSPLRQCLPAHLPHAASPSILYISIYLFLKIYLTKSCRRFFHSLFFILHILSS